jgi:hypothetical protein
MVGPSTRVWPLRKVRQTERGVPHARVLPALPVESGAPCRALVCTAHRESDGGMSELRLQLAAESINVNRPLTLHDRAFAYSRAFPECPNAVWVAGRGRWLYGVWQIGAYFKNQTRYYGAYPASYLERVAALFPEIDPRDTLHAFSGSLPAGKYTRLDLNESVSPELCGSVYDVATLTTRMFALIIADPPYTATDAKKYGTPPLNKRLAISALAGVTKIGGFLVWLDTMWPIYRKDQWEYCGAIELRRSTNHRIRGVTIWQRKAGA